jgi:pyruvate/2-oxoglutarate dehydrogenase complex dihydrolipoamide dehydrogenase (E3) component
MVTADDDGSERQAGRLPAGWSNPRPEGRYDLAIVGGSRGAVAAAMAAAELGTRVALIARDLRYEDNTIRWLTGSTPGETAFAEASHDWRRQLASELPLWELLGRGIDIYFGEACFVDPRAFEVTAPGEPEVAATEGPLAGEPAAARLGFRRALLAVGSGWASPDPSEPTLADCLTPAALSMVDKLPRRLLVVGDGSQACEIAQAFCRLGAEVHLLTGDDGILPREDRRAADWLLERLAAGGIRIDRGWTISASSQSGRWKRVVLERQGQKQELIVEQIVAAGEARVQLAPLDPVAAGIRCGAQGIEIDSRLQTSNRAVFAMGPVTGQSCLAGAVIPLARLAVRNALRGRREKADRLSSGRATYTDPQWAHVGLTLAQADAAGRAVENRWLEFTDGGEPGDCCARGLASMLLAQSSCRLLGLTIVGRHAAALAADMAAQLSSGRRLADLADCTAISAGHQRVVEQIVAACRGARV